MLTRYSDLSRQSPETPPPDHEADVARARELEDQARKDLLKAGCTPCCPIDLESPLENNSDEYGALAYYQSVDETGLMPLMAQLAGLGELLQVSGERSTSLSSMQNIWRL